MTDSNRDRTSTSSSHPPGNSVIEGNGTTFELPDDVPSLVAMRKAIDAKIEAMQSTGVTALLAKFADEAAALGKTPEEILGIAGKNRRKAKSKHDE